MNIPKKEGQMLTAKLQTAELRDVAVDTLVPQQVSKVAAPSPSDFDAMRERIAAKYPKILAYLAK